jgi:hypothetical protein
VDCFGLEEVKKRETNKRVLWVGVGTTGGKL